MPYVPFTYGEHPLPSAKLNSNFAVKADLDAVTGKVVSTQLPDLAAIAAAAVPPLLAPVATQADAALAAARAAAAAAAAAQATANAAIPAVQEGVPGGVATLGPDGLLLTEQRPPASGGGSVGPTYTPPLAADFPVFVNTGPLDSPTSDTPTGLLFSHPEVIGASAGNVLKGVSRALPTGDFDIEVVVEKYGTDWPFFACGVSLVESASTRYHSLHHGMAYYPDPWNGSFSRDSPCISELFWTNTSTISDGRGIPYPAMRLHQRIQRVNGALRRWHRLHAKAPWVDLWGMSVPQPFAPDRIALTWHATMSGSFTSYPPQPFTVLHYGPLL